MKSRDIKLREVLGEVIREYRQERLLSMRQLSERSCIALSYISELERGKKEASSEILARIAEGLDLPTYVLVVEAGYRMQEWNTPEDILDKSLAVV